ncbi:MAG: hypothetical protein WKF89_01760 [Chitinophagaceae bacterium]
MADKRIVLVFAMVLIALTSKSQANPGKEKLVLRSISNIAMLNGSKETSIALQTILGASLKGVFAGVGAGIDYYRFRSVPVFFDLRYEYGKGPLNFFAYGQLGYNFDWLTDQNIAEYFISSASNYKGGLYYDAGLGYKIPFKNKDALLLSAGFSFKKVSNQFRAPFCPFAGPCQVEMERYVYLMQRFVLKAGWSL